MDIRVVASQDIPKAGAAWVVQALAEAGRADATLMPALGESALGVYRVLGEARERGELDTRRLRLVQLDEYWDIGPADPRSLLGWLRRDVAGPLDVPDARIVTLDGSARDAAAECRRYDDAVAAAGGIDVAVLGLGPNGHLGFNEPPSAADAPTRFVQLAAASLESNARYWPGRDCPASALTAGMTTILAARRVLLVVSGAGKRAILDATLTGPITADIPATALRDHPNVTVLADDRAWPAWRAGAG